MTVVDLNVYEDLWKGMDDLKKERCCCWAREQQLDTQVVWRIELIGEGVVLVYQYLINEQGRRYFDRNHVHPDGVATEAFVHSVSSPPPWLFWD